MNILLTHKHSGSLWIRYIVEYISKHPTAGLYSEHGSIGNNIPIGTDLSKECILQTKSNLSSLDYKQNNGLILLLRSYKDVFYLDAIALGLDDELSIRESFNTDHYEYLQNIIDYKAWPGKKMVIYYEDLQTDSKNEIIKILNFLNIELAKSKTFFDNYNFHKYNAELYIKSKMPYIDTEINIPTDMRVEMDNIFMYMDPMIFTNYLVRYME